MSSAPARRVRHPPLSREPVTIQERDALLRQRTQEFSGDETSTPSSDDAGPPVDDKTEAMSLLDILQSIPGIQRVQFEDEAPEDEMDQQRECRSLLPEYRPLGPHACL